MDRLKRDQQTDKDQDMNEYSEDQLKEGRKGGEEVSSETGLEEDYSDETL